MKRYFGYWFLVNWFVGNDIGFFFFVSDGSIVVLDREGVCFLIILILFILNLRIYKIVMRINWKVKIIYWFDLEVVVNIILFLGVIVY